MSAFKRIEIMVSFGHDQMPWWKGVGLSIAEELTEVERSTDLYRSFLFFWYTGKDWETGRTMSDKEKAFWIMECGR